MGRRAKEIWLIDWPIMKGERHTIAAGLVVTDFGHALRVRTPCRAQERYAAAIVRTAAMSAPMSSSEL